MPEAIQECSVTVNSVIFASNEGFAIFLAKSEKEPKPFIAKGYVGDINSQDELVIWGDWKRHPKYGQQLQISRFQVPQKSVLTFLKNGFIKGVGPALADRVWKKFGEDTTRILDEEPDELKKVSGIGDQKLRKIKESWAKNRDKQKSLVAFQEWGIGPKTIQKIFKKWPNNSLEIIRENPYLLAWEIDGVGFLTADKIALNSGIEKDAPERIQAGIHFALQEASTKGGHCYLLKNQLNEEAIKVLCPDKTEDLQEYEYLIDGNIEELISQGILIRDEDRIYTQVVYNAERNLAYYLKRLQGHINAFPYDTEGLTREYEERERIRFDSQQKQAIKSALDNKVCIITGGPGTGKTTIVNAILKLAWKGGLKKSALVAPTGRAAKRLQESTGHEASTIHRYLGYNPSFGFEFDANNQVEDELIICDEASMLDTFLAKALTAALPHKARLIFVGDIHQLPSVGAGNILRDCIQSGQFPVTILDTIHRQDEGSWIVRNAHAVKNGQIKSLNLSNKTKDFFWKDLAKLHPNIEQAERCMKLQEFLIYTVKNLKSRGYTMDDIQVLTPIYKGPAGVGELNSQLQTFWNPASPAKAEMKTGFKIFRQGDRVMQLKNNYDKEVFNGDQGKIVRIENEDGKVFVDYEGVVVEYAITDLDQITLSFACTIHKSQGSEFPITIIPVTVSHYIMLARNLIYTAITRARQMCVLLGEKKALAMAVSNNKPIVRNTNLRNLLSE